MCPTIMQLVWIGFIFCIDYFKNMETVEAKVAVSLCVLCLTLWQVAGYLKEK